MSAKNKEVYVVLHWDKGMDMASRPIGVYTNKKKAENIAALSEHRHVMPTKMNDFSELDND